jgi:hypothetical protein
MLPRSKALYFAFQFIPIIIMLAVALALGKMAEAFVGLGTYEGLLAWYFTFIIVYYLIFFLMYRTFVNKNNYNDNTSGVAVILSMIEKGSPESLGGAAFILFDNEEKGLFGSMHFAEKHKDAAKHTLMVNLDCVGDGETIVSLAKKEAMGHELYPLFAEIMEQNGTRFDGSIQCRKMLPMMFPSDQSNFKKGVGVCALNKSPLGMYCARIHTPKDTICREENVKVLAEALVEFVEKM